MSALGPPVRFLIGVIGLWAGARVTMLWMSSGDAVEAARADEPQVPAPRLPVAGTGRVPTLLAVEPAPSRWPAPRPIDYMRAAVARLDRAPTATAPAPAIVPALGRESGAMRLVVSTTAAEPPASLAATPVPAVVRAPSSVPATSSRWSASAFLFARGGDGGVSLAGGGGQLGASQAGARIAYALDRAGRVAVAARAYAPLGQTSGSEAAVGVDLHPIPAIAFRLSVERRVAIGRDGRSAWSAYAAGGFFRGLPGQIELDGFGQAGVVGARTGDLFVDGALRVARRVAIGGGANLLVGAGVWGAAQPSVERLDVGPHVAVRLPAGASTFSIAADWRLRAAGDARPGSGPALTAALDF